MSEPPGPHIQCLPWWTKHIEKDASPTLPELWTAAPKYAQPPHHITDNNSPDTSVGLLEGCHSSHLHGSYDLVWHLGLWRTGSRPLPTDDNARHSPRGVWDVRKSSLTDLPLIPSRPLCNSSTTCRHPNSEELLPNMSLSLGSLMEGGLFFLSVSIFLVVSLRNVEKTHLEFCGLLVKPRPPAWNGQGLTRCREGRNVCCADIINDDNAQRPPQFNERPWKFKN